MSAAVGFAIFCAFLLGWVAGWHARTWPAKDAQREHYEMRDALERNAVRFQRDVRGSR